MKLALIAIGIPGAGKTTLLAPLAERYGLVRISRDEIRQELFGDPLDRSDQDRVWQEADAQMRQALSLGASVVLDSTFLSEEKRRKAVADARAAGADRVIGIVFPTLPDVAKVRNAAREHRVREEVIDRAFSILSEEPPQLEDGFDALYESGQLRELEAELERIG